VARTEATESEIQSAICEYLTARRVFFIRLNNIPASFIDGRGARQFRSLGKYARLGTADLLVIKGGCPIFIEVKRADARQSADQIEFQHDVAKAGGYYHVARSIDDVQALGLKVLCGADGGAAGPSAMMRRIEATISSMLGVFAFCHASKSPSRSQHFSDSHFLAIGPSSSIVPCHRRSRL